MPAPVATPMAPGTCPPRPPDAPGTLTPPSTPPPVAAPPSAMPPGTVPPPPSGTTPQPGGSGATPPPGAVPAGAMPPGAMMPGATPMGGRGPAMDPRRARLTTVRQDFARLALGLFANAAALSAHLLRSPPLRRRRKAAPTCSTSKAKASLTMRFFINARRGFRSWSPGRRRRPTSS